MQTSLKLQKAKLDALELICKEYIAVYRDSILTSPLEDNRVKTNTHRLIIEPKEAGVNVNNYIEGKVTIEPNYWANAEFGRIVLRTFMILKSLYKDFDINLTIPSYFKDKLKLSEDTFRILATYKCHINFLDTSSFEEDEEVNMYNVYWAINKSNMTYIVESDYVKLDGHQIIEVGFTNYLNNMVSAKVSGCDSLDLVDITLGCDQNLENALIDLVCAYSFGKDNYHQSVYLGLKTVSSMMVILNIDIETIKQYIIDICNRLNIRDMSFINVLIGEISYNVSKINALSKTSRFKNDMSYIDLIAIKMLKDGQKNLVRKKEEE